MEEMVFIIEVVFITKFYCTYLGGIVIGKVFLSVLDNILYYVVCLFDLFGDFAVFSIYLIQ